MVFMRNKINSLLVPGILFLTIVAQQAFACSVPVFRYALERWERDEYRIIIASKGELSAEKKALVEKLIDQSYSGNGSSNLSVITVDIDDERKNKKTLEQFPQLKEITEPTAFLLYPNGKYFKSTIWKEKFTTETLKKLTSSDLIKNLTQEILRGKSTVWLFVESGNNEADEKAYAVLEKNIKRLSKEIVLPKGVIETSGKISGGLSRAEVEANYDPDNFLKSGIPLKIEFSIVRLKTDAEEPVLRAILGHIESDLEEYKDKPMVYPFFGRGRFLLPLIAGGINAENLTTTAQYLAGACSCQVKSGNPGIDTLTHLNWASFLEGSEVVLDKVLPPLIGTAELASVGVASKPLPEAPVEKEVPTVATASSLSRNLMIILGSVILVLALVSVKLVKKKQG
jgi:hypothetical protein